MRTLWRDVREHKVAAVLLLVWWLAILATLVAPQIDRWSRGGYGTMVDLVASYMLLGLAFVAGVLVGWRRVTGPGGHWRLGDSVLSGLLAGVISLEAMALGYIGLYRLLGPLFASSGSQISPLWPLETLGYTALAVGVGTLLGAIGGLVGSLAARASGRAPSESQSVEMRSSR